jgi:hypothetical protein
VLKEDSRAARAAPCVRAGRGPRRLDARAGHRSTHADKKARGGKFGGPECQVSIAWAACVQLADTQQLVFHHAGGRRQRRWQLSHLRAGLPRSTEAPSQRCRGCPPPHTGRHREEMVAQVRAGQTAGGGNTGAARRRGSRGWGNSEYRRGERREGRSRSTSGVDAGLGRDPRHGDGEGGRGTPRSDGREESYGTVRERREWVVHR